MLLAFAGLWLARRRPRLGHALAWLGVAGLCLLSTPWIADRLEAAVESYPAFDLHQPIDAQAIVILGGGGQRAWAPEYGGPSAEPYLLERLAYGAFLARRTGLPVLVTGFHVEAVAMRDTLQRNFGLAPRWLDDQAYDTFQNVRNSVRLLRADQVRRVLLVTSAAQMRRAVAEFTAAGMPVVPAPAGVLAPRALGIFRFIPDPAALERSHGAIYEMLGERVREMLALSGLRRQTSATAP